MILLRRWLAWRKTSWIVSNSWLYIDIIIDDSEQVRIVVFSFPIRTFLSYLRTFVKCARIVWKETQRSFMGIPADQNAQAHDLTVPC
jgi:hypothetical protein